jgi:hypothetical protein
MNQQVVNKLINEITNNDVSTTEADRIQFDSMDDLEIRRVCPDARIITNSELAKYNSIDDLFPLDNDHIFLLYGPVSEGHWVLLSKYNNIIEFFNSYSGAVDDCLVWYKDIPATRIGGGATPYLTHLLRNCPYKIIYNGFDFQNNRDLAVATCGRWCCLRHQTIQDGMPLKQFIDTIKAVKKKTKLSFDNIVSDLINIH